MPAAAAESPSTVGQRIDWVKGFLRRRYLSVLIPVVLALPVAAFVHYSSPATYTASASMIIETRKNLLQDLLMTEGPADAAWIESQIGVLKSGNVAAYVVKQLRLADDPLFIRT